MSPEATSQARAGPIDQPPGSPGPVPTGASTMVEILASHARRGPNAPAILAPDRPVLTYGALAGELDRAAQSLSAAGLGRGSRIAVALPNGPEMAVAVLAASSWATCAPLDPKSDDDTLRLLLRNLRADALIVPADGDSAVARVANDLGLQIVRLASSPATAAGAFRLTCEDARPPVAVQAPRGDDVALVLHTSGTTATPKLVPLNHRTQVESSQMRAQLLRLTPADRCLCVTPLFTASGIRRNLFTTLAAGGSVVCTPGFDAGSFFEWLDQFEPTFFAAGPAILRALRDELDRRAAVPRHSLRFILSGSAALPAELQCRLETAFGVPVLQAYAMTEAGAIAQEPLPPGERRSGSVGRSVGSEIAVLGDDGRFLAPGAAGEVVVRGREVFGGYESDPEASRLAFHGGWFRTGDLGYMDHDGFLFLTGRAGEIINRGGLKVSPSAVDAAMLRHAGVAEAATFGVPHPTLGEDVVTAVVLRESRSVTPRQLRDFSLEHLAAVMVPSQVLIVDGLPKNALGKVRRRDLALTLQSRLRAAFVPPRDVHEEVIAGLFAEVLGIERVGAHDNFFALGGDSLRATQLVARVNSVLRSSLVPSSLFGSPTVAEFAAVAAAMAGKGTQADPPAIRRSPRARKAPGSTPTGDEG